MRKAPPATLSTTRLGIEEDADSNLLGACGQACVSRAAAANGPVSARDFTLQPSAALASWSVCHSVCSSVLFNHYTATGWLGSWAAQLIVV